MWTELAQPIREQNGQVEQTGLRDKMPPEARFFLSVAKYMVKRKTGNLNCPKLLGIEKEKATFRMKSGLFVELLGGFEPLTSSLPSGFGAFF